MRIQAPTYAFVGASTITNAATVDISGPPAAGTNATITNPAALVVESGNVGIGTTAPGSTLTVAGTGLQVTGSGTAGDAKLELVGGSSHDWYIDALGSSHGDPTAIVFYDATASITPFKFNTSAWTFKASYNLGWDSQTQYADGGTADVGLTRSAAGVLEINNGTVGTNTTSRLIAGLVSIGTATAPSGGVATFNGNVGIGTTTPGAKLTVVPAGNGDGIFINRQSDGTVNGVYWGKIIQNSSATSGIILGESSSTYTTGGTYGWLGNSESFLSYPTGKFKIATGVGATPVMTLDASGNVGIGTTAPYTKMEVVGGALQVGTGASLGSAGNGGINIYTSAGAKLTLYDSAYDSFVASAPDAGNSDLTFGANNTERMRILGSNGNVGIGTASPSAPLNV